MGDEQLIDLVSRYEVIYNVKCSEYRDASLRNAAWEEIAKLHDKPIEECKDNWNKLRNCYNNAMKRRQKKSGRNFAPWRFEEQMSFLKPCMGVRYSTGNHDADVSNEIIFLRSPKSFPYSESQLSHESIPSRTSTPISNTSYKRKATTNSNNDNYLANMVEIMKSSQENRMNIQEMDDLDTFFLSMSKTLKKLPKLDQLRIKMDLHKAVSEAEIKQLESQQNVLKQESLFRVR